MQRALHLGFVALAAVSLVAGCGKGGGGGRGGSSSAGAGATGGGASTGGAAGGSTSAGSTGAGTTGSTTGSATGPAPAISTPVIDPVLEEGARGAAVGTLQGLLNAWRARAGEPQVAVDAAFGPQTVAAVERFQADHGLPATGIVWQDTWDALRRAPATDVLGAIDPASGQVAPDAYAHTSGAMPDVRIRALAPIEVKPGLFRSPLVYQSGLSIDADGAGPAWRSDPWGQSSTSLGYATGEALDPIQIAYFVLPIGFEAAHPEVRIGDLAAVVHRNRVTYAIYGDRGPQGKIGEASIATAGKLGIFANPRDGGAGYGVTYIVFPGSGDRAPLRPEEIEARGRELFVRAGGNL